MGNRVACRFKGRGPHLVLLRDAEFELVYASALAADRKRREPLGREDAAEALCLIKQADAGGHADPAVSHEFGKGDGILDPGPAGADRGAPLLMFVAETFYPRCDLGHLRVSAVAFVLIKALLNKVHMFLRGTVPRLRGPFIRVGAPAVCPAVFLPDSAAPATTEFLHRMISFLFCC